MVEASRLLLAQHTEEIKRADDYIVDPAISQRLLQYGAPERIDRMDYDGPGELDLHEVSCDLFRSPTKTEVIIQKDFLKALALKGHDRIFGSTNYLDGGSQLLNKSKLFVQEIFNAQYVVIVRNNDVPRAGARL